MELISNPFENDFIRTHATDPVYEAVVRELSGRTTKKGTGRKLALTAEMFRLYLYYVSMGVDYKEAAESAGINERTRRDYALRSTTFSDVSSLAKQNVSLRARITVAKSIMGQLPQYFKLVHPETKDVKYIELKEIPANVATAQWWLEKVDKIGGAEDSEAPQLGAPRNEKEAELLERLLNKHHDYVEAKKKNTK